MTDYFVDKANPPNAGNGTAGNPWHDWHEIDQGILNPGDRVLFEPGTYHNGDNVPGSINPITITTDGVQYIANPATATAVNPVVHSGGRTVDLPDNEVDGVTYPFADDVIASGRGLLVTGPNNTFGGSAIYEDGTPNGVQTNFYGEGFNNEWIRIEPSATGTTIEYATVRNNGNVTTDGSGFWSTDQPGIEPGADNITIRYCIGYNNGQDFIQGRFSSEVNGLVYRNCYSFNRPHQTIPNVNFNRIRHADSLQLFASVDGVISNILIENCVFGHGMQNSLLLGDTNVDVENATIRNCLFIFPTDGALSDQSNSDATGWIVENNTFVFHTQDLGGFPAIRIDDNDSDGGTLDANCNAIVQMGPDVPNIIADPTITITSANNIHFGALGNTTPYTSTPHDPQIAAAPTGNFDTNHDFLVRNWPAANTCRAGASIGSPRDMVLLSQAEAAANSAPTVTNPGNVQVCQNTAANVQINASDPDVGDTLTYSVTGLPSGLSIGASSGLISGSTAVLGTFNVTVTVSDGLQNSQTSFLLEVAECMVTCSDLCKSFC